MTENTTDTIRLTDVANTLKNHFGASALPASMFEENDLGNGVTLDSVDFEVVSPQVVAHTVKILTRMSFSGIGNAASVLGTDTEDARSAADSLGALEEYVTIMGVLSTTYNFSVLNVMENTDNIINSVMALSVMVLNNYSQDETDADTVREVMGTTLTPDQVLYVATLVARSVNTVNAVNGRRSPERHHVAVMHRTVTFRSPENDTVSGVNTFDIDFTLGSGVVMEVHTTGSVTSLLSPVNRYKALAKMEITGVHTVVLMDTRRHKTWTLNRSDVDADMLDTTWRAVTGRHVN